MSANIVPHNNQDGRQQESNPSRAIVPVQSELANERMLAPKEGVRAVRQRLRDASLTPHNPDRDSNHALPGPEPFKVEVVSMKDHKGRPTHIPNQSPTYGPVSTNPREVVDAEFEVKRGNSQAKTAAVGTHPTSTPQAQAPQTPAPQTPAKATKTGPGQAISTPNPTQTVEQGSPDEGQRTKKAKVTGQWVGGDGGLKQFIDAFAGREAKKYRWVINENPSKSDPKQEKADAMEQQGDNRGKNRRGNRNLATSQDEEHRKRQAQKGRV